MSKALTKDDAHEKAAASSLWRHREFLNLWAAQSISAVGSRFTRTALPVIAVLAVDGSPLQLGALLAGTAGNIFGARATLWVGIGIGLLVPLLLVPLRRLQRIPSS